MSNLNAPTTWLTAVFALVGLVVAALMTTAVGLRDVALAAGFVAALAGVAGSLVPPGLTRQVAVPAGIAVALAPPLALAGEGRPVIAGVVSAVVFTVGTLAPRRTSPPAGWWARWARRPTFSRSAWRWFETSR